MTTKRAKILMLAMAIGDGYVRKDRPELMISHGINQKEYAVAKAKLLRECTGRAVNTHEYIYNGFGCVRFAMSHQYFKLVRKWLYKNDQKILSLNILRRLTDEAVAIWYMDDGSLYAKKRNGIPKAFELVISTCCSTVEEAQTICDFFYERYTIKMTIKKMKGKFSIRCGTHNARILISKLEKYCMPGMEYKFLPILEKKTEDT